MERRITEEEILKAFGVPKELFNELNKESTKSLELFKEQFFGEKKAKKRRKYS